MPFLGTEIDNGVLDNYTIARITVDGKQFQGVILADTAGEPLVNLSVTPAAFGTVGDGSKNVTTAGTRVQLAASQACKEVEIVAKSTNTGNIWVGGSAIAAGSGRPLLPLQSMIVKVSNLNLIYLDSDVNGEGVTYIYYN